LQWAEHLGKHFAGGVEIAATVDERCLHAAAGIGLAISDRNHRVRGFRDLDEANRCRRQPLGVEGRQPLDDCGMHGLILAAGEQPDAVIAQMFEGIDASGERQCLGMRTQFGD